MNRQPTVSEFVDEALDVAWLNVEIASLEGRGPSTLEDRLLVTSIGFLMAWKDQEDSGAVRRIMEGVAEQYAAAILGRTREGIEYDGGKN
jgi:hypothetical protein